MKRFSLKNEYSGPVYQFLSFRSCALLCNVFCYFFFCADGSSILSCSSIRNPRRVHECCEYGCRRFHVPVLQRIKYHSIHCESQTILMETSRSKLLFTFLIDVTWLSTHSIQFFIKFVRVDFENYFSESLMDIGTWVDWKRGGGCQEDSINGKIFL